MAARYWVGGTGNWTDAANHWSDASGGAPGAGLLPTAADDVYFDTNSISANATVTLNANAVCNNLSTAGVGYQLTIASPLNTSRTLSVYGNIIFSVLTVFFQPYYTVIIPCATTTKTITTNGASLPWVKFNGVGGKWVFQDAYNGYYTELINGEIDTNGFSVYFESFTISTGTKALTMTSNTLTTRGWTNNAPLNFTFNRGTGTVVINTTSSYLTGTNTFYNLTIQGKDYETLRLEVRANQVILNELKIIGYNSTTRRILIWTTTHTTVYTITAQSVYVENADFMCITAAGNANWDLSACVGNSGDCGNNTNITFTNGINCYWYNNGGNWADAKWYSQTNGGGVKVRVPLPQDDVYIDSNSLDANASIVLNVPRLGKNISILPDSILTLNTTYNWSLAYFGNFEFNTTVNPSINIEIIGYSVVNYTINTAGKTIRQLYNRGRAKCSLLSDIIVTGIFGSEGELSTDDYNITAQTFGLQGNYNTYLTSSYIILTGTMPLQLAGTSDIVPGTSTIHLTPPVGTSEITLSLQGGKVFNNVIFGGLNTGGYVITYSNITVTPPYSGGSATFNNITIEPGRKVSWYVNGLTKLNSLTADGTVGNLITITSKIAGTVLGQHILQNQTTDPIEVSYCNISYSSVNATVRIKTFMNKAWTSIKAAGGKAKAGIKRIMGVYVNGGWTARNSINSGNNTGWNFE